MRATASKIARPHWATSLYEATIHPIHPGACCAARSHQESPDHLVEFFSFPLFFIFFYFFHGVEATTPSSLLIGQEAFVLVYL